MLLAKGEFVIFWSDLREFRDRILHQGGEPPPIFDGEESRAARVALRERWRDAEPIYKLVLGSRLVRGEKHTGV